MQEYAEELLKICRDRGVKIATAESCTGGMVAAALTDISGSSDVFERGFVTYSNEAKVEMLGIPAELIEQYGAVSEQVACAMADGAVANSHTDLVVAITGIAGPAGGSNEKPVGLVYIAIKYGKNPIICEKHIFTGNRDEIRIAATKTVLNLLKKPITEEI